MNHRFRRARVNVKVLCLVLAIVTLVGTSLVTARYVRRRVLSTRDLAAGKKAYAQGDWQAAFSHYAEYLGRNLDDIEILREYAQAGMSIRPLDSQIVGRAIGAYRQVLQLDPTDDFVMQELATIYTKTRNFKELIHIANQKLDITPNDPQATLWLIDSLIGQEKQEEAAEKLTPILEQWEEQTTAPPAYIDGCVKMGSIYAGKTGRSDNDLVQAQEWLNKAIAKDPNAAEARLLKARVLSVLANTTGRQKALKDSILRELNTIAALEAPPAGVLLEAGKHLLILGELDEAKIVLERVKNIPQSVLEEEFFDINGWLAEKYAFESKLALRTNDIPTAIQLTNDMLAIHEEKYVRASILPTAIECYIKARMPEKARQSLGEYTDIVYALKIDPSARSESLNYLQALVAEVEGKPGLIIDALQPEVVSDNANPRNWRLLASAYLRVGQTSQAIEAFKNYLDSAPNDVPVLIQLTRIYLEQHDGANALVTALEAEKIAPSNIGIKLLRIEAEIEQTADLPPQERSDILERLSRELTQYTQATPQLIEIRLSQANIAIQQEKFDAAIEILERAIQECSNTLQAEMRLVTLYLKLQRPDDAIKTAQAACKRHAQTVDPWVMLAVCHEQNQDPQAALTALRQGLTGIQETDQQLLLQRRIAALEIAKGDRAVGINILKDLATQNKQDVQSRDLLLLTPEIQSDQETAQQLITELRQAEGESGFRWRYHQATLWIAVEDWQSHQQDIIDDLQFCINANSDWILPRQTLIRFYQKIKDFPSIENLCRQILAENPQAQDVAQQLIILLNGQGRYSEAEAIVKELGNEEAKTRWNISSALRERDFSKATEELKQKIASDPQDIQFRLLLSRMIYGQTKDAEQALAYITEAEAIAPHSTDVVFAKVAILNGEGRSDEALQLINNHIQEVGSFDAYQLRAYEMIALGRPQEAEKDYRHLLTFTDKGAQPYVLLSKYYFDVAVNIDKSIETLQSGLQTLPDDSILQRQLVRLLFQRGTTQDRQEAQNLLSTLIQQNPNDTELLLIQTQRLIQKGTPEDIEQAQSILEQVVKQDPTLIEAQEKFITLLMLNRTYEQARSQVIQAKGSNPNSLTLMALHARIELILKNIPMATRVARTILDKSPTELSLLNTLVFVASNSEDSELLNDIVRHLETCIQTTPQNEKLRLIKVGILESLNQDDQAITELKAYTQSDAGRQAFNAYSTLSHLYMKQGKMELAQQTIQQAAAINPHSPLLIQLRIEYATYLYQYGQTERATTLFQELYDQSPDNGLLLNNYAWLLQDQYQRYKEALEMVNHGLELHPKSDNLLDTRAVIFSKMEGRLEDAKNDFIHLVELSTTNIDLSTTDSQKRQALTRQAKSLLKLGRVCERLGETNQAQQYLLQALQIDQTLKTDQTSKNGLNNIGLTEQECQELTEIIDRL